MGYQRTDAANHDGQQQRHVLGLQCQQDGRQGGGNDESVEEHSRTYLVFIACAQVVYGSDGSYHRQQDEQQ